MPETTDDDRGTYRIAVTLTNETAGHCFSDFAEDIPDHLMTDDGRPDFGAIYRAVQLDYGRCTGSIYVDNPDNALRPIRVGWHFASRQRYEDTGQPYLRGAWVSVVRERPAVRTLVAVP